MIKELSAKTGIPVTTLDCYLKTKSAEPSAKNAVKIAQALAVSVEYLVTGKAPEFEKSPAVLSRDGRMIIRRLAKLSPEQCRAVLSLIRVFQD